MTSHVKIFKIYYVTAHVAEEDGNFELCRQIIPQVMEGDAEKDCIEANLPMLKDIQLAKNATTIAQLYMDIDENKLKTRVYRPVAITPDIVECLIKDRPINLLSMLQSVWKLLHEKDLLLTPKNRCTSIHEPLERIINMLSFAYSASIMTDEDEEESEKEKEIRELTKCQVRSLVSPIVFTSALAPAEEAASSKMFLGTIRKLAPTQEKENESQNETIDLDTDNKAHD